jgi:hypothetical protein
VGEQRWIRGEEKAKVRTKNNRQARKQVNKSTNKDPRWHIKNHRFEVGMVMLNTNIPIQSGYISIRWQGKRKERDKPNEQHHQNTNIIKHTPT